MGRSNACAVATRTKKWQDREAAAKRVELWRSTGVASWEPLPEFRPLCLEAHLFLDHVCREGTTSRYRNSSFQWSGSIPPELPQGLRRCCPSGRHSSPPRALPSSRRKSCQSTWHTVFRCSARSCRCPSRSAARNRHSGLRQVALSQPEVASRRPSDRNTVCRENRRKRE
jgi:hypothetical protein